MAVLPPDTPSKHITLIKWCIKATKRVRNGQCCIIITSIWAQKTGLLSCYTAWNYTFKHNKHSNDQMLSQTRCQPEKSFNMWTVLRLQLVLVKWLRCETSVARCVSEIVLILLPFISVEAALIAPRSSLLKAGWTWSLVVCVPLNNPLDQSWY